MSIHITPRWAWVPRVSTLSSRPSSAAIASSPTVRARSMSPSAAAIQASDTIANAIICGLPDSRAASSAASAVSAASCSLPRVSSACARPTCIGMTNWPWPMAREMLMPRRRWRIASS